MSASVFYRTLTPAGTGGVGIMAVEGAGADALLQTLLPPGKMLPKENTFSLYTLQDEKGVLDEALICQTRKGYELQLHGSALGLSALARLLSAKGAKEGRLPFGCPSALAQSLLSGVKSTFAVKWLLAQNQWPSVLLDLQKAPSAISPWLEERLAQAQAAMQIVKPYRVALRGAPNAGKSSLFNALLGRDAALTSPMAGTTRDYLEEELLIEDTWISLVDTAGLSETADSLDVRSQQLGALVEAQLTLWVIDGTQGVQNLDPTRTYVCTRKDVVAQAQDDPGRVFWVNALEEGSLATLCTWMASQVARPDLGPGLFSPELVAWAKSLLVLPPDEQAKNLLSFSL